MTIGGKVLSASALARLLDPRRAPRLFSIGDSHSAALRETRGVTGVHLGPVTLHRAGRPGELERLAAASLLGPTLGSHTGRAARPIVKSIIREGDSVLYSFGEIDVRAHFQQHWPEYGAPADLARALAYRGVAAGASLAALTGARAGFASVTPPAADIDDVEFPTTGSVTERHDWTVLLNEALADACATFAILFVDFFAAYADAAGQLDPSRSDGAVHIRPDEAKEVVDACVATGLLTG